MQTSDFQATVPLPASGDCYGFNVMSGKEQRFTPAECDRKKNSSIMLDSQAWKLLRGDIEKNCQYTQCKQLTGAFDGLFLSIDKALQQIPGN